ncbi:hypothetical protein [Dechloromonas sp. HYN0024]|uniref:hypothetical protein n=1 Tax=Dechloromonas sp. HYN0024 TaxID=2231055 RepID=UPI001F072B60|nr:hypothetical protein [Dechloromonas sp. HYN0024]
MVFIIHVISIKIASNKVVATVSNIFGKVYASNADGMLGSLNAGDAIYEGESVVSSDGGLGIIHLADGRIMTFVSGEGEVSELRADRHLAVEYLKAAME